MQYPWMAAITGTVRSAIEVTDACIVRTAWYAWAFDAARDDDDEGAAKPPPNSFRSSPTLKCGPFAAMISTRTSGSAAIAAAASGRSRHKALPMALRASLRSSHNVAT